MLHDDAIVIDTCGPEGPAVYTPEILAALDVCTTVGEALEVITTISHEALLRGELEEFWTDWKRSGVDVSCLTIGVGWGEDPFTYNAAVADIDQYGRLFDSGRMVKVTSAADIARAHETGTPGLILTFQNTTHFGDDLESLDYFARQGVRIMQLTYNTRNVIGDGCMEADPQGLTAFGREAVKRMNENRVVVDTSHCSEPTSFDALDASDVPIAITHAMARSVYAHDRAKSDELIKAIGADGYVGVLVVPFFLTDA